MHSMNKTLSVVVPCFNEESCIRPFVKAVRESLPERVIEFMFVDDGSTDGTLAQIKALAGDCPDVHFVSFSRNFGKEAALLAGLRHATGDFVVTMDVDLQDPPSLLPEMLAALESGEFQCAATRRVSRTGEPPIRSWFARLFYWIMSRWSDVEVVDGARDYRMMTRRAVEAVLSLPETNRFTKGIYQWIGFKTKWFVFENVNRMTGETKWSFWKLFAYALDGILAFSTLPLQLTSVLGFSVCVLSLIALVFVILRRILLGDPVAGWASLVCVIIAFSGIQLFFIGVLGLYLAKTYRETKHRPMYVESEAR